MHVDGKDHKSCKKIIIFGPPGSGKGSQAKKISEYLSIPHFSTGDLLRTICKDSNPDNTILEIKNLIDNGKYVSDKMISEIVKKKINGLEGYILDGYPRTINQTNCFLKLMKNEQNSNDNDESNENHVIKNFNKSFQLIFINVPLSECIKRIINRNQDREDDCEEVVRKRYSIYLNNTFPILKYLNEQGINYYEIDGIGSKDTIWNRIKTVID